LSSLRSDVTQLSFLEFSPNLLRVFQEENIGNQATIMKVLRMIINIGAVAFIPIFFPTTIAAQAEVQAGDSSQVIQNEQFLFRSDSATSPLKPPDRSSPRATLQSFLDNINRAYHLTMAAHQMDLEDPGLFLNDSVRQLAKEAEIYFLRSMRCLDLSGIPKTFRRSVGYEKTLMLKEIFDRIELPPLAVVPDAQLVEKDLEEKQFPKFTSWEVPNTDITIARVEEGPLRGEYLFTVETVSQIEDFYEQVKHLPYQSGSDVSPGFFDFCIGTPGRLVPPWWNKWLPTWTSRTVFSFAVWQWLALFLSTFLLIFGLMALYHKVWPQNSGLSLVSRCWRWTLFFLLMHYLIWAYYGFIAWQVNLTGKFWVVLVFALAVIFWICVSLFAFFASRAIAESMIVWTKADPEGIQAFYNRAILGVIGVSVMVVVFVYGLSNIGVALGPILAGVGISSLAVVLAVRPMMENIVSSFIIFMEKPYQLGELVDIGGKLGFVESIGLRSTKLRLLAGPLIMIPTEKIAKAEIKNIGRSPYLRRDFSITVPYTLSVQQINRAMEILKEILTVPGVADQGSGAISEAGSQNGSDGDPEPQPHPNDAINRPGYPPRIYFNNFNPDSLNIMVAYWYHPFNYWKYLEHTDWVNKQIKDRFDAEGIEFAYPTQKLYLASEEKSPFSQKPSGEIESG